ncbi:MAG: hypothetical protein L0170_14895 [Acidobacteria bacterium]|nr:hypothetical protein [Acidobacteriota bacterium]
MRRRLLYFLVLLGNSWVCFRVLKEHGYEGDWMPLQSIMSFSFPPPVGHRVLFVLLADGIQVAIPSLGYLKCFLLSQLAAILLAFEAIRRWGALFVREELSIVAQFLLAIMLIPTLHYYDFYDFGVVFFFTAGLYCLFTDRFLAYLLLLAVGTLNHEITLLLVPVFMAIHFPEGYKQLRIWGQVLLQLAAWGGVRALMFWLLPSHITPELRLQSNIEELLHPTSGWLLRYVAPCIWMGVALLGYRRAPQRLRRAIILLPLLATTTFVYGQFHEVRQFDAFIPVLVALILCCIPGDIPLRAPQQNPSRVA